MISSDIPNIDLKKSFVQFYHAGLSVKHRQKYFSPDKHNPRHSYFKN